MAKLTRTPVHLWSKTRLSTSPRTAIWHDARPKPAKARASSNGHSRTSRCRRGDGQRDRLKKRLSGEGVKPLPTSPVGTGSQVLADGESTGGEVLAESDGTGSIEQVLADALEKVLATEKEYDDGINAGERIEFFYKSGTSRAYWQKRKRDSTRKAKYGGPIWAAAEFFRANQTILPRQHIHQSYKRI
jgi:hypothetical protein